MQLLHLVMLHSVISLILWPDSTDIDKSSNFIQYLLKMNIMLKRYVESKLLQHTWSAGGLHCKTFVYFLNIHFSFNVFQGKNILLPPLHPPATDYFSNRIGS